MLICVVFFALAAALIAGKEQNLERLGLPARRRPGRGSAAVVRKTSRPVPSSFPLWRRGMVPGDAGIPVPRPGDGESGVVDGARVGALEKLEESQARGGRSGHGKAVASHRARMRRNNLLLMGGAGLVAVAVVFGLRAAGWTLVVVIAAATAAWVLRRAAAERARRNRADETTRVTVGLAMLLRSGQIPTAALAETATDCDALAPVAAVARLGGDVPAALQEVAQTPGREGLARVAGAWRVAERTGAPVASVLLQVAEGLRAERELAGVVEAELAMARGSARIMAFLPLGALLLGSCVGADPLGFLLENPLGLVLALAGVGLAAAGVVWTEKLAAWQ